MREVDLDYEHLMACRDPDCWYCNDEPEPRTEMDIFFARLLAADVERFAA